jgi:FkbM family methyltransferase
MKQVHGIYLPETDTHFDNMISVGKDAVAGKGTYQLKKYHAALQFVENKGFAVDVGAHVGLWSRVMSYDFIEVAAFEPLTAHRDCFNKNLINRHNVTLYPFAVSDTAHRVQIGMPEDNTGHAHVVGKGERLSGEQCEAIRLDSMRFDRRVDFLKIDVEGWELPVIQGAETMIRRDRPTIIIEQKPHGNAERYGWGQHDAVNLLRQWGFVQQTVIAGDHILTG